MIPIFKYARLLIIVLIIAAAAVLFKANFIVKKVDVIKAVSMPLKETVFGVGYVGAEVISDVAAQVSGKIERTPLAEGAEVKSGEVLVIIDAAEFNNALDSAKVNLQKAEAQLESIKTNISMIGENMAIARSNMEKSAAVMEFNRKETARYKSLLDSNQIAPKIYDEKQMAYTVSAGENSNASVALKILAIEKEKQAVSEKLAASDIENAKISIKQAALKCEYSRIRAPFDGVIVKRFAEEGMVINSGSPVMRVVKKGSYWVSSYIDISQMQNIRAGQSAEIILNRQPGAKYIGKVYRIEQEGDKITEELKVDILFDSNIQNLYLDEKAEVHIETSGRTALAIPSSCAVSAADGRRGIFVLEGSKTVFRKIEFGIMDRSGFTEVLNGLAGGESIVRFEEMHKLRENETVAVKKEGL